MTAHAESAPEVRCTFCEAPIDGEVPVEDEDGRPFCSTDCVGHAEAEKAGA